MPLRKLRNLANLNKHAPHAYSNTSKTLASKRKAQEGKENESSETIGRPKKKLRKARRAPKNASSSDISNHNALDNASHAFDASDASDTGGQGHLDHCDLASSAPPIEDFETDPRVIDVPDGEDDPSNAYGMPPPDNDSDDESPDALDALQLLLFVPTGAGKRKRNIESKINGWERKHLEEISTFLHLYTGKDSKTRGQWMESSVQVVVGRSGKGTKYGAARNVRQRARKYIFEREVPESIPLALGPNPRSKPTPSLRRS
ncbi:hypothetical protein B0H10DRAFT_1959683 [Mycena sp. CBHHK59/15]|nr:hypothetical protein B0H10DRAFT_1959683 [Mycena sp. CBHHK59/15]